MAEFPELGKNCQHVGCNCMDFLPFICQDCKKFFCKDHRFYHGCPSKIEPRVKPSNSNSLYQPCRKANCSDHSFYNIYCSYCNKTYCQEHRLPESHECEQIPQRPGGSQNHSAVSVERPTFKYEPISGLPKYYERSRKIAMMRHKSRMLDLFRSTENVIFTLRIDDKTVYPVSVPAYWTLSRSLSSILEQCNILNDSAEVSKYNLRRPDKPEENIDLITVMCAIVSKDQNDEFLLVKST
uniref:AN1-type domain-containing protein n=1 Tax=Panagrolaimus sp. JU765 TaxID=591449 RepID=A0AC34RIP5_9BILA